MIEKYKPLTASLRLGASIGLKISLLFMFCIWFCSGEEYGAGREEFFTEEIFPLEMTKTVQKSGAAFDTLPGTLDALNLHKETIELKEAIIGLDI